MRQVELEQSAGLTQLFVCLTALPLIEMSSLRVGACFPVSVVALLLRQMTFVVLKLSASIACDSVPRTSRDAGISKGRLAFFSDFLLPGSVVYDCQSSLMDFSGYGQRCQRISQILSCQQAAEPLACVTGPTLVGMGDSVSISFWIGTGALPVLHFSCRSKRSSPTTVLTVSWTVSKPSS